MENQQDFCYPYKHGEPAARLMLRRKQQQYQLGIRVRNNGYQEKTKAAKAAKAAKARTIYRR
jgi:hypothetical protein